MVLKMINSSLLPQCNSLDELNSRYSLLSNPACDGSSLKAFPAHQKDTVKQYPDDKIWTATGGPAGDLIISQGFHTVGVVEFYITENNCLSVDRGLCFSNFEFSKGEVCLS